MLKMQDMPYHIGIRGKLYLDFHNQHLVSVNDGADRYVYNHLVGTGNELYQLRKVADVSPWARDRIAYLESVRDAKGIKNSAPFLYGKDTDSSAVDNAIQNYHAAWKNMKERHTGVPTFHKKSFEQSYQTCNHYKNGSIHMNDGSIRFVGEKHIVLPLLGKVRIGISKKLIRELLRHADLYQTRIGTVRISRDAVGEYWFSMQLASAHPFREELVKTGAFLGIDLNIENFLTDSNDRVVENPRFLKKMEAKLAKAQHKLSRMAERAKKEGRKLSESKNYQKQRKKVAYIHRKIERQRNDFQHTESKAMIESQDMVAAEDLKVRNMKKNHKLAKAISDVGWRSFLEKLQYKADLYGKSVVLVDPKNTTQTCSVCGHVLTGDKKLTLKDREWVCPKCGTHHIRDGNSARNILAKALEF